MAQDPFKALSKVTPATQRLFDADTLARSNRIRRINALGPEGVARAERAGRTFAGGRTAGPSLEQAVNQARGPATPRGLPGGPATASDFTNAARDGRAARTAPGGSPNPPPRAPTGTPRAARPTPSIRPRPGLISRGVRATGRFAAKGSVPLAVALGGFEAAAESDAQRAAFLEKIGFDPEARGGEGLEGFSDSARYFGGAAQTINKSLFEVPERLVNKFRGGSFFDDPSPAAAPEATPETVPAADELLNPAESGSTAPETRSRFASQEVLTDPADIAAGNTTLDRNDASGLRRGEGFLRNEQTGDVTRFNAPPPLTAADRKAINTAFSSGGRRRKSSGSPLFDAVLDRFDEQLPARLESRRVRDAATKTTADAALVAAGGKANKPEKTDVIQPFLPGDPARVVQVRNGIARELPVQKPIPTGHTKASLNAEANRGLAAGEYDLEFIKKAMKDRFGIDFKRTK